MSKLPTQHLTKCALTYIAEEAKLLPRNLRSKFVFLDSSMVERTAVNRDVVGSSPTRGAGFKPKNIGAWLSLVERSVRDREVAGSNPVAPIDKGSKCFPYPMNKCL